MIEIDTQPPKLKDPWLYARTIFGRLLVAGALAMMLMGYTDYRAGMLTPFDKVMLPVLTVVTLAAAGFVIFNAPFLRLAVGFNALVLLFFYEGLLLQAVLDNSELSAYSLASTAQFLPGFYIALFVFLTRRAALFAWLIYGSVALLCGLGMMQVPTHSQGEVQKQIYWAILASHPCCILVLSFMTHLRDLIEEAQHESMAAKERFLAVVSHEVRSPLQTIVSSLELFESAPSGPVAQRAIDRIKSAATVLERQIRDLTAFTKLELSPDLQDGEVDPSELLSGIHQAYLEQAARSGLALKLSVSCPGILYRADGVRIQQIIENLVGNALKYTASGGITLGCEHVDSGGIHLWVQDTGRGIPAERVRQVFEPFVRIKASPQERIEGSGLGLAVVRQLVGLMKGSIQVDTQLGQGTTVHVRLPVPRAATLKGLCQAPKSVLVVDDDMDIRHAIVDLLKDWGVAEVLEAEDGLTAIELLRRHPVDVGLIDLQLPGASGYDIARATRREGVNRRASLIAVSAVSLDPHAQGASAFNDYLPKPVSRASLIGAIAKALG